MTLTSSPTEFKSAWRTSSNKTKKDWGWETSWSAMSSIVGKILHIEAGKGTSFKYYKNKNIKVVSEENEMENENELDEDAKMGKQSDDNLKSMMKKFRDMEKKDPKEPSTKFMIKRIGKEMKKRGLKEMNEGNELIQRVANAISFYEAKSSTGYELYHKDFSSAMQHAYAFAKKKYGITIDPKEIDDKVATGPKKPSKGKTNKYRLKGKGGTIQVQVANLDDKKFELNMYKEENEMNEKKKLKPGVKFDFRLFDPEDSPGSDKANDDMNKEIQKYL